MSPDDLRKKLEELGIPVGSWRQGEGGTRPAPLLLQKQRELMAQMKTLLEVQVEKDKKAIADLHEKQNRMKHGGGS